MVPNDSIGLREFVFLVWGGGVKYFLDGLVWDKRVEQMADEDCSKYRRLYLTLNICS